MSNTTRTIRFRGITAEAPHRWVYGDLSTVGGMAILNNENNDWYSVIPETVGQLMAFVDIRKKDVYEGDKRADGMHIEFNPLHNQYGWYAGNGYQVDIQSECYDNYGIPCSWWIDYTMHSTIHDHLLTKTT